MSLRWSRLLFGLLRPIIDPGGFVALRKSLYYSEGFFPNSRLWPKMDVFFLPDLSRFLQVSFVYLLAAVWRTIWSVWSSCAEVGEFSPPWLNCGEIDFSLTFGCSCASCLIGWRKCVLPALDNHRSCSLSGLQTSRWRTSQSVFPGTVLHCNQSAWVFSQCLTKNIWQLWCNDLLGFSSESW